MSRIGWAAAAFGAALIAGGAIDGARAELPQTTNSHGLSAFGELKYGPDFAHFDYVNPDAPKGGRMRTRPVIATRTFDSFNPFIFQGDAADGAQYLYDTLMTRAFDEPDAMYGLLAESVTLPEDRSFAEFRLREAARFSDGTPVTAEDVVFSIEAVRDTGHPVWRSRLAAVAEAIVVDPLTVRVVFRAGAPSRDLPASVAQTPIFSKAYFADKAFDEARLEPPVTSGPYKVGELQQGRYVIYERREDYWGVDLPVNRGRYNFDRIRYDYFVNADAQFEAFARGVFDLNEEFKSQNWATKYDFPAIQKGWVKTEVLPDGRPSGTQGYFFNTRKAKFSDHRVREALAMMFDFEWSNKTLFYNLYTRTDSFFENSELQAEGEPSAAELALLEPLRADLPEETFGPAASPPVTDGSGQDRRIRRQALRKLQEAGWRLDAGVLVGPDGRPMEIEFLDRSQSAFDRITAPYIQNLERIGVKATLRQVDPAQYERRLESYDFDVVVSRYVMRPTPGVEIGGFLSSTAAEARGSFNLAGVSNPAIDALIEALTAAQSREELQTAARALDRAFRAGHYWAPNWHKGSYTIAYWDRFGRPADLGLEQPLYDRAILDTWWFDPEKSAAIDAAQSK
ncbi:MAG: extracellular solute-binding protein [Pseudomonadota bacterium]